MKKCGWCGAEYPDTEVRCLTDGEPLPGGDPQEAAQTAPSAPAAEEVESQGPFGPRLSERQIRMLEVALVCGISLGGTLLVSTYDFFGGSRSHFGSSSVLRWTNSLFHEGICIVLLWYVLMRRSKSFSSLGLSWAGKDAAWSVILYFAGLLAFGIVFGLIQLAGLSSVSYSIASGRVARQLFSPDIPLAGFLFQFVNPFFEEMIVRGYVMTEIQALTQRAWKAVVFSTLLQMSYHFYQGAPMAFAEGATFLVFSIYYLKTHRLAPVILAHLYMDVGSTVYYALRQG